MTDIAADQESTPRKKPGKKAKRKCVSKKVASPSTKKTKAERCCTCTMGRCKKGCECRKKKKLCRNCGSPNCENKLDTALDVKNSAEEKQSSYTPDGAATTPTQQPKKPNGGETKQNRSPNRCVMIQSFAQADHCFRNARNECYRQQLTVLMDQVTG